MLIQVTTSPQSVESGRMLLGFFHAKTLWSRAYAATCKHRFGCQRSDFTLRSPLACCRRAAGSLTRAADVIEQRGVSRGVPPNGCSRFSSGALPPLPPHLEVDGSSDAGSVSGMSGCAGQVRSGSRVDGCSAEQALFTEQQCCKRFNGVRVCLQAITTWLLSASYLGPGNYYLACNGQCGPWLWLPW